MLSHRFLTADRLVQETRFAGGVSIVVNFGAKEAYTLRTGEMVAARSWREVAAD